MRTEPQAPAAFDPPGQPTAHVAVASVPQHAPEQSWEAPAWLAEEHAQQATAQTAPAANTTLTEAPQPERTSLEDVALRMQRIKASAAAVRNAVHAEAATDFDAASQPAEDPDESARTMVDGAAQRARVVARAAAVAAAAQDEDRFEQPAAPPAKASSIADDLLGDDFGRDGDDFDEDDPGGDDPDEDDLDDGFKHAAFGDGFDEDLDDEFEDDDFGDFGDVGASRPLPWKPIAAGAGVVLVAGLAFFWGRIFPPAPDDTATAIEESADSADAATNEGKSVAKGSIAAPPEPKAAVPGAGQPVTPEGTPAAVANPIPAGESGAPVDPAADPAVAGAPGVVPPGGVAVEPGAVPVAVPPGDPAAGAVPAAAVAGAAAPAGSPPASAPLDPATLEQLEEARGLYRKGGKSRLRKADEILGTILASRPNHPDALVVTAQVKLELGQPEDALSTATTCTQVAPEMADCWLTIGVLQQDGKEKESAALAYERYLALAPDGAYAGQVRKQLKRLR